MTKYKNSKGELYDRLQDVPCPFTDECDHAVCDECKQFCIDSPEDAATYLNCEMVEV